MGTPYYDMTLGEWRDRDGEGGSGGGGGGASGGITSAQASSIAKQVALPKNSSWTTTVGGYTMTYTSNGGFSVYGSGASVTLSGGAVAASATQGIRATYYNSDFATTAGVELGYGGADLFYDGAGSARVHALSDTVEITGNITANGGMTINGSAITQASSAFDGTSLGIGTLEGGVKYICQSALTALSIGSAAPGCNGTVLFTVASGAVVTPPANVPYFGVTSYTPGSSYLMMVNDVAAVCNEAAIVPGA